MKFPNLNPFRRSKTPEEVEQRIADKAARRAARLAAKGKAASLLEDAREGYRPKSLAVRTVQWSGYIIFVGACVIILAGYWYDILFYGQQAEEWYIIAGLVAFAFVIRSLAAFGDVLLHWTKPGQEDDEDDDLQELKGFFRSKVKNDGDRAWLRSLWVMSIIACSFATMSFFSAGHESRQAQQQALTATSDTITSNKADRIAALEKQKTEAREARDAAIVSADATIAGVQDQFSGVNTEDNVTIRDANASKNRANATYTETVAGLNAQINEINAEAGKDQVQVTQQKNSTQPFQTVYTFLSRAFGTAEMWAIAGAFFFAILFELLIAKLLAIVSVLNKVLKRISKGIQMREAADEMQARIALQRMKANIDLDEIRLKAQQAEERAAADIMLAKQEREVEKARAHAEALRQGMPWIDPDEMLDAIAAEKRAENEARIRKMNERTEKLRNGEIDPDEDPETELTDAQKRGRKLGQSNGLGNSKIRVGDQDPFNEMKEAG